MKHVPAPARPRHAFTLIELIVVISIITILVSITAASMKWVADKDRAAMTAVDVSHFFAGARSRAQGLHRAFGVRLILDESGPTKLDASGMPTPITATSLMYIQSAPPFSGSCDIDPDNRLSIVISGDGWDRYEPLLEETGFEATIWVEPKASQLRTNGVRRVIHRVTLPDGSQEWQLTGAWAAPDSRPDQYDDCAIEITPAQMWVAPEQTARELTRGIAIDLESMRIGGRMPPEWYDETTGRYRDELDLVFEPDGKVSTRQTAWGITAFVVAHVEDIESSEWGATFYKLSTRPRAELERIVAISAATGELRTKPVRVTDSNGNDVPDDPFKYAETGRSRP